jgi:mannose-6-phosphate isomerase class I
MIAKQRWSKVYESSEEELVEHLAARSIVTERWTAEEQQTLVSVNATQNTQLWCGEGSCMLTTDDQKLSVQTGDTIKIPQGTIYQITAGMAGCIMYQK